ncbi:hypothetical protein Goari_010307 [Gossypium aridum]|uniref:Uncharacterized protein n=1 Tax=Gossypium aridum TaxID=34290 RepID=A0A7J8Y0E5_GOSAI|nr:hypothetical protein [Gossypium aridum]
MGHMIGQKLVLSQCYLLLKGRCLGGPKRIGG